MPWLFLSYKSRRKVCKLRIKHHQTSSSISWLFVFLLLDRHHRAVWGRRRFQIQSHLDCGLDGLGAGQSPFASPLLRVEARVLDCQTSEIADEIVHHQTLNSNQYQKTQIEYCEDLWSVFPYDGQKARGQMQSLPIEQEPSSGSQRALWIPLGKCNQAFCGAPRETYSWKEETMTLNLDEKNARKDLTCKQKGNFTKGFLVCCALR